MVIVRKVCVAIVVGTLGVAAAAAQGVIIERNVSLQMARVIADAAMECVPNGRAMTVAVVDRAGQLRVLLRGDGSPMYAVELARRKAYTARVFRRPSLEWAKRTEGTDLAGQRQLFDVIPLGGGVPITIGDETIGAVGVSGSGGQQKDEDCAKGAIAKVADQLK